MTTHANHTPGYARVNMYGRLGMPTDAMLTVGYPSADALSADWPAGGWEWSGWVPFRSHGDADRFAAAWNACHGVPTAALTPDLLGGLVVACVQAADRLRSLGDGSGASELESAVAEVLGEASP